MNIGFGGGGGTSSVPTSQQKRYGVGQYSTVEQNDEDDGGSSSSSSSSSSSRDPQQTGVDRVESGDSNPFTPKNDSTFDPTDADSYDTDTTPTGEDSEVRPTENGGSAVVIDRSRDEESDVGPQPGDPRKGPALITPDDESSSGDGSTSDDGSSSSDSASDDGSSDEEQGAEFRAPPQQSVERVEQMGAPGAAGSAGSTAEDGASLGALDDVDPRLVLGTLVVLAVLFLFRNGGGL